MPIRGLREFQLALDKIMAQAEYATKKSVVEGAHQIEAKTKAGAPVVTGTLRRSIAVFGPKREGLAVYSARVGPTTVYGRRVSLGFHGPDSRGRVYNQSGNPYFETGFRRADLQQIFTRNWAAALLI